MNGVPLLSASKTTDVVIIDEMSASSKRFNASNPFDLQTTTCPLCTFQNPSTSMRCVLCRTALRGNDSNLNAVNLNEMDIVDDGDGYGTGSGMASGSGMRSPPKLKPREKAVAPHSSSEIPQFSAVRPISRNVQNDDEKEEKEQDLGLRRKMEELMDSLNVPQHVRSNIHRLPTANKMQMLQQFKKRNVSEKEESQKLRQRKQSKSRFGRRSKSKKKPPKPPKSKKRSKTMSVGKDWNYGFNPIDIDSLPSPKTSKSKMNSMAKTQSFDEELRRKVGAFKLDDVQKQEPLVSVYDAFIVQFGEYPQTAEALVEFSKIDGRFQALNLMDAQRIIAENVQIGMKT